MVYCGRPSGACHACRERRTRCDELPEGCTQCAKARRECPGYRSLGDVIFKDVTTNVIRKAKARHAKANQLALKTSPSTTDLASESDATSKSCLEVVQQHHSLLDCFSLAPTIEDRATGFFVTNYVVGLTGPTRGHLGYLAELYRNRGEDEALISSIKAVGLAGFAHATRDPSLIRNARYQYMKALQHTNAALRSPADARKDSTLLTIIILGIFEAISGGTKRSLKDWAAHINGAVAVVKVRGYEGIKSPAGRRMMVQVTSNLLISCLLRGVSVPDHISELMNTAIKMVTTPDPAFIVMETMMRFASLRAEVVNGTLTDPYVTLSSALELDGILLSIATNTPPGWEYKTVFTDTDSDFIYNGRYHVYHDYLVSQIWNALRIIRFMLNEMIRDVLRDRFSSKSPRFTGSEYAAQSQMAVEVMYELQDDILYSLPQHVGFVRDEEGFLSRYQHSETSVWTDFRNRPDEELPLTRISGGLFLIWPLWFVGTTDTASEPMRQFVINNLRSIGDTMGIQQSYILAAAVEAQTEIKI